MLKAYELWKNESSLNEELRQEYVNKSKERIKDYSKENIVKQWENLLKE